MIDHRPCERNCPQCNLWKHHSRYRSWTDSSRGLEKRYRFSKLCRDCEQKNRNALKNVDRPRSIIEQRAKIAAAKAGKSLEFFWVQMNYRSLVPLLRALMTDEGLCLGCGHGFLHERDIQIEHCEAPRHKHDWARLHARNLRLFCASCNGTKGKKPFSRWLDEQEGARMSHFQEQFRCTPVQMEFAL